MVCRKQQQNDGRCLTRCPHFRHFTVVTYLVAIWDLILSAPDSVWVRPYARWDRSRCALSLALAFVITTCTWSGRKIAHWRKPWLLDPRCLMKMIVGSSSLLIGRVTPRAAEGKHLFAAGTSRSLLALSSRLWEELFEIFQQVRCGLKQARDLSIHILDRLGLALVSLQYFEELLVDIWLRGEAILKF